MSGRFVVFLLLLVPTVALSQSDEVRPGELNPAEVVERVAGMPERGSTMAAVRQRLGEPGRRVAPVGEPPISRWVYERFTVYFEHDRVLHAVKNRNR